MKERVPYSYFVDHEAPPPGLYRPKFSHIDAEDFEYEFPIEAKSEFKTKHVELDYLLDGKGGAPRGRNNIIIKKPECIVMSQDKNMHHRFIMTGECTLESR